MRWKQPQITLAPRSIANCIDFAILFYGRHLSLFLKFWAIIAIPCCVVTFALAYLFELGGWATFLIFLLATSPLGTLVTLATTPTLTGTKCSMKELKYHINEEVGTFVFFKSFILRITAILASFLFIIPGIWIALRHGFAIEKASLESMKEPLHNENTDQLLKEEWGNSLGHAVVIMMFCTIVFVSLFFTIDFAANSMFSFPIFWGRLWIEERSSELNYLLWYDPWVHTLALATALFVYPIGRLAWFFCYVDCRVRYDCWDIELKFNDEVRHLETRG